MSTGSFSLSKEVLMNQPLHSTDSNVNRSSPSTRRLKRKRPMFPSAPILFKSSGLHSCHKADEDKMLLCWKHSFAKEEKKKKKKEIFKTKRASLALACLRWKIKIGETISRGGPKTVSIIIVVVTVFVIFKICNNEARWEEIRWNEIFLSWSQWGDFGCQGYQFRYRLIYRIVCVNKIRYNKIKIGKRWTISHKRQQ